jgi:carboxypeptidase family protein
MQKEFNPTHWRAEMTILKSTCILLLTAAAAFGADQGSISGRILTAAGKGAAVPKAPLEARNLDTQATYKVSSALDGSYELGGLPAGAYEISVNYPPFFFPFRQAGVRVTEGKTIRLDIRLDDFNLNTLGDGGEQFVRLLADKSAPSGPVPRTSDGKPDLSGVWQGALPSPGGQEPEPLPWAEAIAKERRYTG